jgi:hypothetical protein
MTDTGLLDFRREGGWNTTYLSCFKSAWMCRHEFELHIENLSHEESRIRSESGEMSEADINSYISYCTGNIEMEAYRAFTSANIYICMAIEGFLNYYGTIRLGESLYKRLLERVGITEKLSIIFLLCFQKRVSDDDLLLCSIRKIFDKRNTYVHPKAKEFRFDRISQHINPHPSKLDLNRSFEIMDLFITTMSDLDNGISVDFHFSKPQRSIYKIVYAEPD